jgi:hypothetical protein
MTGVYAMPKPVGRRCLASYDGGLAYLSTMGLLQFPQAFSKADEEKRRGSLSDPIGPTLCADIVSGDWNLASSIEHEILIVSGPSRQYVLSSTGAWSVFTGLSATSWASAGGNLYFGTSTGKVCKLTGSTDNDVPISSFLVDRFEIYGKKRRKIAQQVRLQYTVPQPYRPRIQLLADYQTGPTSFPAYWTANTSWMWEDVAYTRLPTPSVLSVAALAHAHVLDDQRADVVVVLLGVEGEVLVHGCLGDL